jgi:hypothetical protein
MFHQCIYIRAVIGIVNYADARRDVEFVLIDPMQYPHGGEY